LENVIERACVLTRKPVIQLEDMPEFILADGKPAAVFGEAPVGSVSASGLKEALRDPEKQIILDALGKSNGNKKEAARILGINRTTLYKKLAAYGIENGARKT
jgi:two-component system response regulator HydG